LIYTAVMGKPDVVYDPLVETSWDKVCYTDLEVRHPIGYQVQQVHFPGQSSVKAHRFYKILRPMLLQGYTYSLWIDSNLQLKADPTLLFQYLDPDSDILLFRHPQRDCLYQEAEVCQQYFGPEPIASQVARYRAEGYPEHNGLYAAGFMLRRYSPTMAKLAWAWWWEVQDFSHRGQISLPYVIWKLGVKVSTFPDDECLTRNSFFDAYPHDYESNPFVEAT